MIAYVEAARVEVTVADDGSLVGLVTFRDVAAVPRAQWAQLRVRDRTRLRDELLVLAPGEGLGEAALELSQTALGRALVSSPAGDVGLLSVTDLSRLLELRRLEAAGGVVPRPAGGGAPRVRHTDHDLRALLLDLDDEGRHFARADHLCWDRRRSRQRINPLVEHRREP